MGNILNINSKFFLGITKLGNLVILNLLFLVCCLPIVTIGASYTALYTITLKMVRNNENYVIKGFLKAFKENFKQSTIIWMIMLVLGFILVLDANLCNYISASITTVLAILLRIFMIIWIMISSYVYPVLAKFNNTIKGTIKNAFVMSVMNLFSTVVILFLNCLPLAFIYFSYDNLVYIIGIYTWIGFAGIAYLNSSLLNRVFQKYIVETDVGE